MDIEGPSEGRPLPLWQGARQVTERSQVDAFESWHRPTEGNTDLVLRMTMTIRTESPPCLLRPRFLVGLLCASCLAAASTSHIQAEDTATLRGTVEQWVNTMQKIQEEQSRWSRDKQVLESNKEGLEQEIKDLEEAIAAAKGRLESSGKEKQEKLEQKRENDQAREALAKVLQSAEAEALRVVPLLPAFYLKENTKLAAAVDALKKTAQFTEEERAKDLGSRLTTVALVLAEAEKFQMRSWVRGEEREVDGKPMLVTTIYFGLSTAFSADERETVALRGQATEKGWEFESLPGKDAPGRIIDLIEVASLKGEIKFVEVPLELR